MGEFGESAGDKHEGGDPNQAIADKDARLRRGRRTCRTERLEHDIEKRADQTHLKQHSAGLEINHLKHSRILSCCESTCFFWQWPPREASSHSFAQSVSGLPRRKKLSITMR